MEKSIRAIVIDDEQSARENLTNMISLYCPEISLLADFGSPKEAVTFLISQRVDCIFLDIQMPGTDGFEFLEMIDYTQLQIIFVTAHSEYAIRAFKANAIDYLLKPLDISDLERAVIKVQEAVLDQDSLMNGATYKQSVQNFISQHEGKSEARTTKITIPSSHGFKIIDTENIVSISANGAYSNIAMNGSREELVSKNIGHFEEVLDASKFIRIHHSHIINLEFLSEFSTIDGGTAVMQGGKSFLIAKRRIKDFRLRVEEYYAGRTS